MTKHTVSMFEGNPPHSPYLKQLINIVVFYPVKSAALMPRQIYSAALEGRRKTRLLAVLCCFVTVMDYVFRERQRDKEGVRGQ